MLGTCGIFIGWPLRIEQRTFTSNNRKCPPLGHVCVCVCVCVDKKVPDQVPYINFHIISRMIHVTFCNIYIFYLRKAQSI